MKKINVFFHGNCFDGAVSAALFKVFYLQCLDAEGDFKFIPLAHMQEFSYEKEMFDADVNAVMDFRYPPVPWVDWWFDHHQTTFMTPRDRKHFESRSRKEHFFWNPKAPSNTGFQADTLMRFYNFKLDPQWNTVIEWADTIDSAGFESPEIPVELFDNAVAFAVLLEASNDPELQVKFIEDLANLGDFDAMAATTWWSNRLNTVRQKNWDTVEDIRRVMETEEGVSYVKITDRVNNGYNKFISYYLEPETDYSVAFLKYPDKLKISVGANPFIPEDRRGNFDIGTLCEKYGGGGHYNVGGIAVSLAEESKANEIVQEILFILRNFERDIHSMRTRDRIEELPEFID
ncbi:hypothetical protein KKF34_05800 [Myxococcota bacterium]|nr:hypothetical protein [Myxococcota bacterium]MBU1380263.1 hypothetical protein [Myxococcota bacterium]MBU1496376.1 hypothetical protein [Myxococcota bacterium]